MIKQRNMNSDAYQKSFKYEMLVRNAFGCPSGMKSGAHQCFMQNAITMENGETFAKHLGSFQKQFNVVKNYLMKALVKLSKTKPFSNSADFFELKLSEAEQAISTTELMSIVEESLQKVVEYKITKQ